MTNTLSIHSVFPKQSCKQYKETNMYVYMYLTMLTNKSYLDHYNSRFGFDSRYGQEMHPLPFQIGEKPVSGILT